MDKNYDFNNYNTMGGFSPYSQFDTNDNPFYETPMFNPIMQYEQTYMYYRCLTQQIEYKIKCKELENLGRSKSGQKCLKKGGQM